jgi:hypothetical protein
MRPSYIKWISVACAYLMAITAFYAAENPPLVLIALTLDIIGVIIGSMPSWEMY